MKMLSQCLSACVVLVTLSCRSPGPTIGAERPKETSDLTWEEAKDRKARLDNIDYAVAVTLGEGEPIYRGHVDITFDLKDAGRPLRVDFFQGNVTGLAVNEQPQSLDAKKTYDIEIPGKSLRVGRNRISVDFIQEYSRQGQGLHKFVDPETKQTFLFSQFESFDANRFMPCFDQPDLRSTFALTADVPTGWQVISTVNESGVKPGRPGRKIWTFEKSQAIPTYLFSLHAGPYHVWRDQYAGMIPLRIFARPSLARYVRPKEWFKVTKQGLKYYETFFASPYPFKKYDQLFVPEFAGEAMENVGAVTFGEDVWGRSEPTRHDRLEAAGLQLHEMAHMWFGNLVTMKWWNDLWLNESFASFMSVMALHDATEFKEAWTYFLTGEEAIAYREDALVTTHPIQADVASVKDSFANFDGITYGKGAAVLKQLRLFVGPEAFQRGLQKYIAANAFKNADLTEFTARLQAEAPERDLKRWSERWLRQSGTDHLQAQWTCDAGGRLSELHLLTTPSEGAKFRPQTVHVGLFYEKGGAVQSDLPLRVDLEREDQVVKGSWPCPDFVYPNVDSEAYAQVELDPASLRYALRSMGHLRDDMLRIQVWQNLWAMVRSTHLPLKDYVALIEREFATEKNVLLIDFIASTISSPSRDEQTVVYYWPENHIDERVVFIDRMEHQYLRRYQKAKADSDEQRQWLEAYIGLAQTPPALDEIARWAREPRTDLDERWMIARQLTRYRHPQAAHLVAELRKADPSDRGARAAMAVEAVQPVQAVKHKWVGILLQPKPSVSLAEAEGVLGSLFPAEQKGLAHSFENEFYEYLDRNGSSENEVFVETVARRLAPLSCTQAESQRLHTFLERETKFVPTVSRSLRASLQEDEICQKIRAASRL